MILIHLFILKQRKKVLPLSEISNKLKTLLVKPLPPSHFHTFSILICVHKIIYLKKKNFFNLILTFILVKVYVYVCVYDKTLIITNDW